MLQVNRTRQLGLFEANGIGFEEAYEIALASFREQASSYSRIVVGYSGGKDSTTVVTLLAHFIKTGQLNIDPRNVWVLYGDTGRELPPLHDHAVYLLKVLRAEGYNTKIVKPKIDKTFWVAMLGRGLPLPHTFSRWCVSHLKTDEMSSVVSRLFREMSRDALESELQKPEVQKRFARYKPQGRRNAVAKILNQKGEKLLMVTGMRLGESITRDIKIEHICTRNGECGTGMWQPMANEYDRLAPLVRWRTCHIFDWLKDWLPAYGLDKHGYPTQRVAEIYGDQDIRTGCAGCSVAHEDHALKYIVRAMPEYASLAPILKLRELWDILLSRRDFRLYHDGTAKSQTKDLGPLTFEARKFAYDFVMKIQKEIYDLGGTYQIISLEERERIFYHWQQGTWPTGWDGSQPVGNDRQLIPIGQGEFELFGA